MADSVVSEKKIAASPEEVHPHKAYGWAARDTSGHLSPFRFSRRATGEDDVRLKVLYCGVCHSDLHNIKNEWGMTIYPVVPGHEIVGVVTEVGSRVEKFKLGDKVGVGCLVDSCGSCNSCEDGFENDCAGWVLTYGVIASDGTMTYGGYSDFIVAPQRFVVRFPDSIPLEKGAPLLCAGITVYSPMKYFGLNQPGKHLGIVGLGGLGHVAIRFAKAFGAKVTVISSSPAKEREAIDKFGADAFLISRETNQMEAAAGTMDGIIDTVSAVHPLNPLLSLLKNQGELILIGVPEKPLEIAPYSLIRGRKKLAGSAIGGMKDTQEMLDFAGKHGITADVEVIPIDYLNTAMERLARNDVKYRFVIDVANTLTHP
ncbi:8-hydroxygeraniol dehydrogenase-like [Wolffia australiana]